MTGDIAHVCILKPLAFYPYFVINESMTTITIPKESTKKEKLVAVSYELYKKFLAWQKSPSFKTFKPTKKQKSLLLKARADYKKGNYTTLHEFV